MKFGDFILDLGNTNRPKASTFRDYVKKFIDPEDLKYLYYYEVPGETYLSTPLEEVKTKPFAFKIFRNYPARPLESVLNPP